MPNGKGMEGKVWCKNMNAEQVLTEFINSWFGVAVAVVGIILQIVLLVIVIIRMRFK